MDKDEPIPVVTVEAEKSDAEVKKKIMIIDADNVMRVGRREAKFSLSSCNRILSSRST